MKKNITIFLLLSLMLVSTLEAMTYRDKGLYGSLSLTYLEDIYADSGNVNIQERIIQEYKLGYKGNIYSPRLVEYTLETVFRYDDITNKNSGDDSKSKIESQDYKISASFIKSTKIPFRIYYKTVDRPTSFIYGNTVSQYKQKLESKGIYGSVDLGLFILNYKSTYSDDVFETDTSVDYRVNKNSELSISKSQKNYNLKLSYTHLDQSTTSNSLNIQSKTISELYDRANLSYVWKMSDTLRLSTNMSYFDSKYLSSESISANAHLSWTPKADYSASISANTTSINQANSDLNNLDENTQVKDTITTSGMNQSFSYRLTKNLNFTQALSYLDYESLSSNGENTSINLGLNYGYKLNETTRASIGGTVSQRDSKLDILNVADINNTAGDEQSFSYSIQTGVSKQLETAESRLNVNLRHSATQSSLDRNIDNTMLNLSLSSKFWSLLNNNLVINYSIDNSNYTSISTTLTDESTSSSVSRISASDSLSYAGRLGIKGKSSASIGLSYSIIDNDGNKITRIIPKLNLGLGYRFGQRLMYKLNLGMYKDLSYDYINYFGSTGLNYEIGKTAFSMTYTYTMSGYDNGTTITSMEKSKFNVKMIRRF